MRLGLYLLTIAVLFFFAHRALATTAPPQTPGIPLVIPVTAYGGGREDADPGGEADRHLFAAILDNTERPSATLASNCPGVSRTSTCEPFKYVDFVKNFCNTTSTREAYQYATRHNENAFLHTYPDGRTLGNRLTWQANSNPTGRNCGPDNPDAVMRMNPADAAFNAYLYQRFWSRKDDSGGFPSPYGVFEDDASMLASIAVGGFGEVSTEYGSGTRPSGFADRIGNSQYHERVDWETALGEFVRGACRSVCRDMALNGIATGAGNIGACSVISNGHCHGPYHAGMIDDQVAINNVCRAATGGNLKYLLAERPIFEGRFGYQFLDSQSMTVEINTVANLYSHTSDGCANTKIVDAEPSYGEGGIGDVDGGHRVRLATLAFRWLVANRSSGIPDRVISFQFTIGKTLTEVAYFFEDTLVPYEAEHTVRPFVWNGRNETVGGGCPTADGDRGGSLDLLVECDGSSGVYCQQYRHLFINGVDYGKTAACLNTGTNDVKITSAWFTRDRISSYRYSLALQGGEMRSVPYRDVPGGRIAIPACSNTTFCTGSDSLASQVMPFNGDGSETLCGPCGIVLLQRK